MQEQYIFVYNALLEALKVGDTVISCVDFCSEYERLCHIDPTKGKSGLLEQFEVLISQILSVWLIQSVWLIHVHVSVHYGVVFGV